MDHSIWVVPDLAGNDYGGSLFVYGGTTQNNNELSPSYCSTEGNLLRLHFTIILQSVQLTISAQCF